MSTQTTLYALAAILIVFVIGLVIWMLIRWASNREYLTAEPQQPSRQSGCDGNCGCNCTPPRQPDCVPAVRCSAPVSQAIALDNLTCDPNDDYHVYAPQAQNLINMLAERKREAIDDQYRQDLIDLAEELKEELE